MSIEKQQYEKDWDLCRRCQVRRPLRELKTVQGLYVCRDEIWCNRQVLAREELAAAVPVKPQKKPRAK